jgi:pimeloyl-ACP methyl ester carboxylesterase
VRQVTGIAVALVALAAAGTGAGLVLSSGPAAPHGGRAAATARPARHSAPAGRLAGPPQNRPGPVLLVPGYGGGTSSLDSLASRIRAAGRTATVLQLPGSGTGSLLTDAAVLNAAVRRALAHGAPSVDVIGYSAGGVVALIWARRDDGLARARRIITLGAPFHGTGLAAAARAFAPAECPAACRQLVPGSALLRALDVTSSAGLPRWLSLWTTDDEVVTPPASARLAGAVNVPVQSVCPSARISHTQLPVNPDVTAMVLQALGTRPLQRPTAADCR